MPHEEVLRPGAHSARHATQPAGARAGAVAAAALVLSAPSAAAQWPQWGGPNRDFQSPATELAEAWPEGGPTKLWERALGAGFSSLVVDGERVFTLYQSGAEEVVVALAAETGATLWEQRYPTEGGNTPPNSTPVVAGDRLYTLGFFGKLCALEKATGKLAWSHDLVQEFHAKSPMYGFAASPLVHGESLIVPAGGKDHGVAAFTLADGKLLWHAHDFEELYASPLLLEVQGETQVVVLSSDRIVGLAPATGALLWSEPIENEGGQNIATPLWSDGLLTVTSGTKGSVALRLSRADGKTSVERVWTNDKQVAQTTVVRAGEHLLGSTGYDTTYVTAFRVATGEVAWQHPGFSVTNLVAADGKLVLLDYEGVLALATAGPEGLRVHSRASVLGPQSFTPPTLAGSTVYVRDLKTIKAFDLGRPD